MKTTRYVWIDAGKGIAILSVLIQHASYFLQGYPLLFTNVILVRHIEVVFFWFYCIIGITSALTFEHIQTTSHQTLLQTTLTYWKKRVLYVLCVYLLASMYSYGVSSLFTTNRSAGDFLFRIFNYSTIPPHYFFWTLLQLYLVAPIIYYAVTRIKTLRGYLISLIPITVFCSILSTMYWYPIFSRPRPLYLGGWAFLLFYLGIGYSHFYPEIKKYEKWAALLGVCIMEGIIVLTKGTVINVEVNLFYTLLSFFLFLLTKIIIQMTHTMYLRKPLAWIGVGSLSIYVIHWSLYEFITYSVGYERFQSIWGFMLLLFIGAFISISIPNFIKYLCTLIIKRKERCGIL